MKINKDGMHIDDYDLYITRQCTTCDNPYKIIDTKFSSDNYFYPPYDYIKGCTESCLHCWLLPDHLPPKISVEDEEDINIIFSDKHEYWYDENFYKDIDLGNLKITYKDYIADGCHIAIMPISRLVTNRSVFLPEGIMIYPEGRLNLSNYKTVDIQTSDLKEILPSQLTKEELSILQSKLSGVTIDSLNDYALMVVPIKLSLDTLFNYSHEKHLGLITNMSETISKKYMNFFTYYNCDITYTSNDSLPSLPSQTLIENMSATLFVDLNNNEAKFISGAVFSNQVTKGLGLALSQPEWDYLPKQGDVGKLVNHAFVLYAQIIKTDSASSKFVQILSLLEFLAYPTEFKSFKDVKKIIARYVIKNTNSIEYQDLLKRFEELTGKKDANKKDIGFRTRIVHIGDRLENLVPTVKERKALFKELNEYVKCVIDHMIYHSHLSMEEYTIEKEKLTKT